MRRLVALVALLLMVAGVADGALRFPPPEFDSGYRTPQATTPGARSLALEYVDVAVLVGGLVLASVLVLVVRRRWLILVVMLACLGYFGFYRQGCVCPIGAIQNVTEGIAGTVGLPMVVALFFLVPLVTTIFFGRTFCGVVCPLGAAQDAVLARPVRVPEWLEHALGLGAYLYLGAAVLFAATQTAYVICRYDPFIAIFRLVDLPTLETTGSIRLLTLAGIFIGTSFVIGRPYCRYLCPYGAVLRVLSRVSWRHATITPAECVRCSLCEDACPFGAIRRPTAPRPASRRAEGKARLGLLLGLVPVLMVGGGFLGRWVADPMARLHRTVQLADAVRREEGKGGQKGSTDETEAFWKTGRAPGDLYADAEAVRHRFEGWWRRYRVTLWTGKAAEVSVFLPGAATWFGVYVGMVVGVKLVSLSIRRRRTDYEPDRATCVSCGRCFQACPVGQERGERWRAGEGRPEAPPEALPPPRAGAPARSDERG